MGVFCSSKTHTLARKTQRLCDLSLSLYIVTRICRNIYHTLNCFLIYCDMLLLSRDDLFVEIFLLTQQKTLQENHCKSMVIHLKAEIVNDEKISILAPDNIDLSKTLANELIISLSVYHCKRKTQLATYYNRQKSTLIPR